MVQCAGVGLAFCGLPLGSRYTSHAHMLVLKSGASHTGSSALAAIFCFSLRRLKPSQS